MASLLSTPWPANPVEGEGGHFEHTMWVKNALIALDTGTLHKPAAGVPAGQVLGTTAPDVWEPVELEGVIPVGVIVMYSGSTIPDGWALCNGQNGTPDLRGKFVLSSSTQYPAGSAGGEASVQLTAAQSGVPAHTHQTSSTEVRHAHNIRANQWKHSHGMDWAGSHAHQGKWIPYVNDVTVAGGGKVATQGGNGHDAIPYDGNHVHGIHEQFNWPSDWMFSTEEYAGFHMHNVLANTAANASQAHSNMPPYYALAYIMKI